MARIRRVDDSKEMEQVIDDFITQGYKVKSKGERITMMKKKSFGSGGMHLIILIGLGWWTLGIPNAIYAAYKYFTADEIQIKVEGATGQDVTDESMNPYEVEGATGLDDADESMNSYESGDKLFAHRPGQTQRGRWANNVFTHANRRRVATVILFSVEVWILYNVIYHGSFPSIVALILVGIFAWGFIHFIGSAFLEGLFGLGGDEYLGFFYFFKGAYHDFVLVKSRLTQSATSTETLPNREKSSSNSQTAARDADNIVAEGDAAKEDGGLQNAIDTYQKALEKYEEAEEQAETDEQEASLEEKIAETQNKLDAVRERKEQIDAVQNPLQNAESSFQTAIVQHAQSNLIPARRDYRQARDQYKQALDTLNEQEEKDVFKKEGEITVSVNLEAEYLPKKLVAWESLSDDKRETLSDAGIGTLSDIRNVSDEVIQELVEDGTIEKELANQLRAVKWWHGGEERTFTSSKTIERQRDRAKKGFQMLS